MKRKSHKTGTMEMSAVMIPSVQPCTVTPEHAIMAAFSCCASCGARAWLTLAKLYLEVGLDSVVPTDVDNLKEIDASRVKVPAYAHERWEKYIRDGAEDLSIPELSVIVMLLTSTLKVFVEESEKVS